MKQSGRSRVDEALDEIRRAIIERRYLPGEALRLDALSQELDMSMQPVREAIRLLEAEGLVERTRNRGAVVAKIPLDELVELLSLRAVIEPMAVSLATVRATDDDLARFRQLHESVKRRIEADEPVGKTIALTIEFHREIYNASGSKYLTDFIARIWAAISIGSAWQDARAGHSVAEHEEILQAMERRDAHAAASAMRTHVRESVETHLSALWNDRANVVDEALSAYNILLSQLDPGTETAALP